MPHYEIVLFDLDGTLTDPQLGITKSVQYALNHMGISEPDLTKLIHFIGPPLALNFRDSYGMSETESKQAVHFYREYFSEFGIFENAVYGGIAELLARLNEAGKVLAVATSKPTVFAERILRHFLLTDYFAFVAGSNLDGTRVEKAEVIAFALRNLPETSKRRILMVGDRKHDVLGAKKNQVDSMAVLYGYGSYEELTEAEPTFLVEKISEINSHIE